jgi:hypothetical protein
MCASAVELDEAPDEPGPEAGQPGSTSALGRLRLCLELRHPLSLLLVDSHVHQYNSILTFLLQVCCGLRMPYNGTSVRYKSDQHTLLSHLGFELHPEVAAPKVDVCGMCDTLSLEGVSHVHDERLSVHC